MPSALIRKKTKAPVEAVETLTRGAAKAAARRDYLLETAGRFFLEKGYEATSVGEIARAAHASKETLYRHFPTKEDLFRGVIQRGTGRMAAELNLILVPQAMPEEALTSFGMILLGRLLSSDTAKLHNIMGMSKSVFPELAKIFYEQGPARVHAVLATYLRAQQALGRLRPMDPGVAARQFLDLVVADHMLRARLGFFPVPTAKDLKATVRAAVDLFLHGYGKRS